MGGATFPAPNILGSFNVVFHRSPATHAMTVGLFILSFWLSLPISWKGSVFDEITTYVDLTKDFFLLNLM